jgi:hypothetical protein
MVLVLLNEHRDNPNNNTETILKKIAYVLLRAVNQENAAQEISHLLDPTSEKPTTARPSSQ